MPHVFRFPPSPTGKMHVGNARTGIFNFLQARHTGGQFVLRIEDTDKERSTPENMGYIFEALAWLGVTYDNPEPLIQSTRESAHVQAAQTLVQNGTAYVDPEGVTRFKVPEGATTWEDLVQGAITIENKQIEDFALLRSNGTPTYHLGVVCDDIFQGVTHIIRGDDHINNTPKQILLYRALGATVPQFGHLPLILNDKGEKLSKRHGAASIQDLRDEGFLPQAVFNFLLRLGWGHGDDEIFSMDEAIQLFDVHQVSKGAARFDGAKLKWLNAHYLKTLGFEAVWPHLARFMPNATEADTTKLRALWPHLTARAQTLPEIVAAAAPILAPVAYEDAHIAVLAEGHHALHHVYDALAALPDFTEAAIHDCLHAQAEALGGFKHVGKPTRVALTAQTGGMDLSAIMAALGQKETLHRLKTALHHLHAHGHGHH